MGVGNLCHGFLNVSRAAIFPGIHRPGIPLPVLLLQHRTRNAVDPCFEGNMPEKLEWRFIIFSMCSNRVSS